MFVAEGEGAIGLALEVEARRDFPGNREGEQFPADFADKNLGAERRGLFSARFGEAVGDSAGQIHGVHVSVHDA